MGLTLVLSVERKWNKNGTLSGKPFLLCHLPPYAVGYKGLYSFQIIRYLLCHDEQSAKLPGNLIRLLLA